jgi:hypothetical protein
MKKRIFGESNNHPDIAASLNNIAIHYSKLGDSHNALKYSLESLEMSKRIFGEKNNHPHIAPIIV